MRRVFGIGRDGEAVHGLISDRIRQRTAERDVFVYFSGHGLTSASAKESYLLPSDVSLARVADTALPVSQLYQRLAALGARSVFVILEAGFGPQITAEPNPPNLPNDVAYIAPADGLTGLAVLAAGDRDQMPLTFPETGIGVFTQHIIEALAGKADHTVGNRDSRVDSVEVYAHVAAGVQRVARKSFGVEQKPVRYQTQNVLIGRLALAK